MGRRHEMNFGERINEEVSTTIADVEIIEPRVLKMNAGTQSYNQRSLDVGIRDSFIQDNQSLSRRGVLRICITRSNSLGKVDPLPARGDL